MLPGFFNFWAMMTGKISRLLIGVSSIPAAVAGVGVGVGEAWTATTGTGVESAVGSGAVLQATSSSLNRQWHSPGG